VPRMAESSAPPVQHPVLIARCVEHNVPAGGTSVPELVFAVIDPSLHALDELAGGRHRQRQEHISTSARQR
jgi:hypothetical protein